MKLIIAAVGNRAPDWLQTGWNTYSRRMPSDFSLVLIEVKPVSRKEHAPRVCKEIEAERLRSVIPPNCHTIALDENGAEFSTQILRQQLEQWAQEGRNTVFLIGGPDGLDPLLLKSCDEVWRLSRLTLPHFLVRVVWAEALYRAVSLIKGLPYHRE